jgi:hypothetical protein
VRGRDVERQGRGLQSAQEEFNLQEGSACARQRRRKPTGLWRTKLPVKEAEEAEAAKGEAFRARPRGQQAASPTRGQAS